MKVPFAHMYITGNTTPTTAQALGNAITGWTNGATSRRGEASITQAPTTGRFTAAAAGIYMLSAQASFETEDISGTSGDGVGNLGIALAKNGTIIAGTKCMLNQAAIDLLKVGSIPPWPVSLAVDDYVTVVLWSSDASGNDVTVREAQFSAFRVD